MDIKADIKDSKNGGKDKQTDRCSCLMCNIGKFAGVQFWCIGGSEFIVHGVLGSEWGIISCYMPQL